MDKINNIQKLPDLGSKTPDTPDTPDNLEPELLQKENDILKERVKNLEKKLEVKNKYIRIIIHDIKGPVGSVLGITGLIIDDIDENNQLNIQELRGYCIDINTTISKSITVLDDLSTVMTLQENNIHPEVFVIQLKEKIDDQLALLLPSAKLKNISLINNTEDNTKIMANDNMLDTVIRNLVSNAIKFTREGGEISVSSSMEGNQTVITIKDSGIGLSEDRLSNLFNSEGVTTLGTNKEKGTGIGLQICKEMVAKMGGTIEAQSEGENKGTTFIIKLPSGEYDQYSRNV